MKKIIILFSLIFISNVMNAQTKIKEPKAQKKQHLLTKHDHTRNDPYFWMNERDSKEVLSYIKEENDYTSNYFESLKPLQEKLLSEFESRINPNEKSAPFIENGSQFQFVNIAGKDYEDLYKIVNNKSTLFFSQNARSTNKPYYDLGDFALSQDNSLLAFSEDHVGRRKYTIFFRNEKTKKLIKDQIRNTDGSIIWANDNKTVFYVKKDEKTLREFQVYKHVLGTDTKNDVLVYEEKDERFSVSISKGLTNKNIYIDCHSTTTSEVLAIDANNVNSELKPIIKRKKDHIYSIYEHENGVYVLSNENAKNNKLLFYKNWDLSSKSVEIIAHDDKKYIEEVLVLKNSLSVIIREEGLQKLIIYDLKDYLPFVIKMNDETYTLSLGHNTSFYANDLYYSYVSMTTPATTYKLNLETKNQSIFFQNELLDVNFSPNRYVSKRIMATANDGTKIPISLVYKIDTDLKNAPILLYGYGSYGATIDATFSALRLSLLDRGFVFAIAHIRGGKYLGENWYENGKLQKKKNTFTDFINAAEHLVMHEYCHAEKVFAQGGSAGGLLMGAVLNMAPYLWKGVVAQVPFVDVVTTMLDESIPLTVGEYDEWGNPNEKEAYWYMLSYSPYDQVKKMDYPAMYITTGYHDSQVQYWEPLKWVAKLRDYRTNKNPLLFDCNMDAGHGGGSGRTSERIEIAKEFSFIINLAGIRE
jgi:oligopeptidase B